MPESKLKNVTAAAQIAERLKQQIKDFDATSQTTESGVVRDTGDGIASVTGLSKAGAMEMLRFENGEEGVVLNLEQDRVGAMILGDATKVKAGDSVEATGKTLSIPVSDAIVGRVVDPLGKPLDGKGDIKAKELMPIERVAPGVMTREPVNQPMMTGIKAIDAMIPIGRGQRELIIGDR
mgnify:FL=1